MNNGNGWKSWALGIAVALSFAFGGFAWSGMNERVASIERDSVTLKVGIAVIKATLERIERKLPK